MINYMKFIFTLILVILVVSNDIFAQCPMCRMAAESNLESGGSAGKGLNTGILYLLAIPYLMVFVLAMIWRKHRSRLAKN
ncbi:MAG: hypothetical protein IPM92_05870 [Saprospiraceae bacterium]|nr:hypothetical protein [Saprospiraceae bacterium]